MQALIDYILQFGALSQQQIDFILSRATPLEMPKHAYLSEAGKVPRRMAFILEGVFRIFYHNKKGQEVTHYFMSEGRFITDYLPFEAEAAASESIQAVTDCTLLVFSKAAWDEIGNSIPGWSGIVERMFRKCMTEAIEKRSPLVAEDATTRYLSFMDGFPALVNRVPLSYVASYLGITQQSLSRVRRSIR